MRDDMRENDMLYEMLELKIISGIRVENRPNSLDILIMSAIFCGTSQGYRLVPYNISAIPRPIFFSIFLILGFKIAIPENPSLSTFFYGSGQSFKYAPLTTPTLPCPVFLEDFLGRT